MSTSNNDPLVPAAAGAEAVAIYVYNDAARPTEADVTVERYPIVAWRVPSSGCASPALPGDISDTELMIVLPDGALLAPFFDRLYPNLDAAKAGRLREAQERWDVRYAKPEAAA